MVDGENTKFTWGLEDCRVEVTAKGVVGDVQFGQVVDYASYVLNRAGKQILTQTQALHVHQLA